MNRKVFALLAVLGLFAAEPAGSQTQLDSNGIAAAIGRQGTVMPGDVYRVGLPRTDLHVTLDGVALLPTFALGSYAAFKAEPQGTLVVGDLCLLEPEIEPVMKSLESSGLRVTALHNHLRNETPHVMYLHYMGVGDAAQLAAKLNTAPASSSVQPAPFVAPIEETLGRKGTFAGGVLSFSVGRREAVTMMGMSVVPSMGVTNVLSFQDAGSGNVATTGDFVLIGTEVNAVEAALRAKGFAVTALHHHMIGDAPQLYYMHFWRVGPPRDLAGTLKDALSHVNVAS